MTVWHWVRHGPTHAKNFVGWRDIPADLSDRDQIDRLRCYLPDSAILLASDLSRASDTASVLQQPDHHRLPDDPHLREIHFGVWDGMHFEDVSARDPVLSRRYWEEPGDTQAPFGESWNEASARVQGTVTRLNSKYPDADIVVAAHFGVILTQLQRALGTNAYDTLAHKIDNLSVTRLICKDGSARAEIINHLP